MTSQVNEPAIPSPQGDAAAPGPRTALMVLGMHRSGTSALSGVLVRLGCDAPATPIATEPENAKGFYESRPVARLNDAILSSAGTSWDDWNAISPAWFASPRRAPFMEQAEKIVETEFGTSPLIALKDPRNCRLVPFWIEVLRRRDYAPKVVIAYRSASEVAASLERRNGFDPALGRLLWLRNVLEAERASRDVPRVFVGYGRLLSDWPAEISRLEAGLDLRLPRQSPSAREEVEDFLTPSMRHFADGDVDRERGDASHLWIRDAHAIFDRWTRDGEDSSDRETLDRIRAELDGVSPVFDRLVRVAKGRAGAEAALSARLERSESALERERAAAEGDREALVRAEERRGALEARIGDRDRNAATSKAEIAALQAELGRRGEVLLTYEQEADDLNYALAELSKSQVSLQQKAEKAATQKQKDDAEALRAAQKSAEAQKRKSDAALARANARIDRITNSTSFRITAPLRGFKSMVSRKR